jgi:DNA-binding PadR family transcriptional regulator
MGHDHHNRHEHHDHEEIRDHLQRKLESHFGEFGRGGRGGRGGWGGERGGWGGGRRMRRGDIRKSILKVLSDSPAHGYEVMRRLEALSGGLWRPSPGSVYPHLQMLEDEGMVTSSEQDGTRTFALTEKGQAEAAAGGDLPWQSDDDKILSLRLAVTQLMGAAKQLSGAGVESQVQRGIDIVQRARKEIYQILAED